MTRIATYGSNQLYISRILDVQKRVHELQVQVSTEKKSQVYSGIAADSNRLLNFENQKATASRFVQNNLMATTKLEAASSSIGAVRNNITELRNRLDTFAQSMPTDEAHIDEIQTWAWQALVEMHSYLSTSVDGQYIFSGGRVSTAPVKMPADSLAGFQALYDGESTRTATTRLAALQDVNLTNTQTGEITFNPSAGTVTATNTGAFSDVYAGSRITVGGVVPSRTFTVNSVDSTGTTVSLSRFDAEVAAAATVATPDGSVSLDNTDTGNLTFSPDGDTITSATAGAFADLPVGAVFRVSGTANNDGVYTVAAKSTTNSTIQIVSSKMDFVVENTAETAGTIGGIAAGAYGSLSIGANSSNNIQVTATNAGSLGALTVGSTITIAGSEDIDGDGSAENDGSYVVLSNNGTTMELSRVGVGSANWQTTAATFTSESWYQGDTIGLKHRVDEDREVDMGIYASDPAFEKAMRAMYLIAQGEFGTAGGLENNMERIDQARWLLTDAIEAPASGSPPFGTESRSDLQSLHSQIGITQSVIKIRNEKHESFIGFLDQRIIDMENVDMTEAIALLLDDQRALEAGYQALAKVREMSLMDFVR